MVLGPAILRSVVLRYRRENFFPSNASLVTLPTGQEICHTVSIPTLLQQLSCLGNNGPGFGETGDNHTIKW